MSTFGGVFGLLFLLCTLYISTILSAPVLKLPEPNRKWDIEGSRKVHDGFFNSFGPHAVPLLLCDRDLASGTYYSKPAKPKCNHRRPDSTSEPKTYNVTFWVMDNNADSVKGIHCFGIRRIRTKTYDGLHREYVSRNTKEPLTTDQCKDMIKRHKTPEGYELVFRDDRYFSYLDVQVPEFKYFKNDTKTWVDYHLQEHKIGIDANDYHITAFAGMRQVCHSDAGTCETARGHLIWNPSDQNKCPIVDGNKFTCVLLDDVLTCPLQQYVLTGLTVTTACNKTIGSSDQQVLFTPDTTTWNNMSLSEDIAKIQRKRNKRHSFSSQSRINAQFQFISEITKDNLYMLQDQICELNKIQIGTGLRIAESGNPDALVEAMLGPGLRSAMVGNAIHVWKCHEIREYMFLNEPEGSCTKEWPVSYVWGTGKKLGWLSGSNELHRNSTPTDCPQPEFYFNSGETTYLLNSKAPFPKFPTLPNPGDPDMADAFIEATFTGTGEYGYEEMSRGSTFYDFMQDLEKSARYGRLLESEAQNSEDLLPGFWHRIKQVIGEEIMEYILIGGVVVVALIVLGIFLCICWKCGKKMCCNRLCRCKEHVKNEKKQSEKVEVIIAPAPRNPEPILLNGMYDATAPAYGRGYIAANEFQYVR